MNEADLKQEIKQWLINKSSNYIISKINKNDKKINMINRNLNINNNFSLSEKIYLFINDLTDKPKCSNCNKEKVSRYLGLIKGYTDKCYNCNQKTQKKNYHPGSRKRKEINFIPVHVKKTNRIFNKKRSLINHLVNIYDSMEDAYIKENDIHHIPTCLACNKKAKFKNFFDGYNLFCSNQCKFTYNKKNNIMTPKNKKFKLGYYDYINNNLKWYKDHLNDNNIFDPFFKKNIGNLSLKSFISRNIKDKTKIYIKKKCVICGRETKYHFLEDAFETCTQHKKYGRKNPLLGNDKDLNNFYINLILNGMNTDNALKEMKLHSLKKLEKIHFYKINNSKIIKIIECPVTGYLIPIVKLKKYLFDHIKFFNLDINDYIQKYFPKFVNECDNCQKFINFEFYNKKKRFCCQKCYYEYSRKNPEEYKISDEQKERQSETLKRKIKNGEFTPSITNSWANSKTFIKIDNNKYLFRSSWDAAFWILNPTLKYESKRIKYLDTKTNKYRNYIVDFEDNKNKILYEIKPECNIDKQNVIDKEKAAIKWCKDNGWSFKFISNDYFKENAIKINFDEYDEKIYKGMKQFIK